MIAPTAPRPVLAALLALSAPLALACSPWAGSVRNPAEQSIAPEQTHRLSAVMSRLIGALSDEHRAATRNLDVRLVETPAQLHLETNDGAIEISGEFLTLLLDWRSRVSDKQSDASLALGIAHELAHLVHAPAHPSRPSVERERAADAFALRLVLDAGYDFRPTFIEELAELKGREWQLASATIQTALSQGSPSGGDAPRSVPWSEPAAVATLMHDIERATEACLLAREIRLRASVLVELRELTERPDRISDELRTLKIRVIHSTRALRAALAEDLTRCNLTKLDYYQTHATRDQLKTASLFQHRIESLLLREGATEPGELAHDDPRLSSLDEDWRDRSSARVTALAAPLFSSFNAGEDDDLLHGSTSAFLVHAGLTWQSQSAGGIGLEIGYARMAGDLPEDVGTEKPVGTRLRVRAASYRVLVAANVGKALSKALVWTGTAGIGYVMDRYTFIESERDYDTHGLLGSVRGELGYRPLRRLHLGIGVMGGYVIADPFRFELAFPATAALFF